MINPRADKRSYHLVSDDHGDSDYGLCVEVDKEFICVWHHGELALISHDQFEIMIKEYKKLKDGGII